MARSEIIVMLGIVLLFLFMVLMLVQDWNAPDFLRKLVWLWIAATFSMLIIGLCCEGVPIPKMAIAITIYASINLVIGKTFCHFLPGKDDDKTRKEGC